MVEKEDGFLEARDVPQEAVDMGRPEWGVVVGPPDLSTIEGLKPSERKAINNRLAQLGIFDWSTLRKRRRDLMSILLASVRPQIVREVYIQIIDLYEQRWIDGRESTG